jgi:hypothetical protein
MDGESPVLDLGLNTRSASRRDAVMDFTVVAHEWGHYLIGRLAGSTGEADALGNLQGQALHEGIADFVSMLVNVSAGDDLHGAFAVGSYDNLDYRELRPSLPATEAPADAMYFGIRRYPYSLDFARNPLTFRHLAAPPPAAMPFYNWKGRGPLLSEVHTTGEVFSQALFQCFGNLIAAHPGGDFEAIRARMAQYLVAGLAAFPDHPSLLDARDALLGVIRLAGPADDYLACRAGFAARGMGADALGPDGEFATGATTFPPPAYDPAQVEESFLDQDRALRIASAGFTPAAGGAPGTGVINVELRNTGLIAATTSSVEIVPDVPAAVVFAGGARADLGPIATAHVASAAFPMQVDACQLPDHPTQPGFRTFDYTVTGAADAAVTRTATFHAAIATPASCP